MNIIDGYELHTKLTRMKPGMRSEHVYLEIGDRSFLRERIEEAVAERVRDNWDTDKNGRRPSLSEMIRLFTTLDPKTTNGILVGAHDRIDMDVRSDFREQYTDVVDGLLQEALEKRLKEIRKKQKEEKER
jgi:hypothetical protein